ncbi:MAG: PEP-CTERM sorting domain-containing protein [Planctomycetota bacterium]
MPAVRLTAVLLALAVGGPVSATPAAHFWLSTKASGSSGPEAPAIGRTVGAGATLYVWGRPTPGKQFTGVSLNVVATATGIDFVDGSYDFYNAIDLSTDRFEQVIDSSTVPTLTSDATNFEVGLGSIDAIRGLNGFTLSDTSTRGPGPVCADGEIGCELASDGQPAWLIGSFGVLATSAGSVDLHLQIGDRGVTERTLADGDYSLDGEVAADDEHVWSDSYGSTTLLAADGNGDGVVNAADYTVWRDHLGDVAVEGLASDTEVRFGIDGMGGDEPTHNAGSFLDIPPGDREVNLPGDDPDATFTIAAPATSLPEPAAAALVAVGMGLISIRRRRPTGVWRFL